MRALRFLVVFAFVVVASAGDLLAVNPSAASAARTPALIVVVSVDQLAYEYLERFRPGFAAEGIVRRCEAEGTWFSNCHHAHAFTYTAPGHAVQLTGCYADTNGIIDNDWFDRRRGKVTYCMLDPEAKLIGTTGDDLPVSPRSLLADTLGDRLKLATGRRAKVFGVAIKDRAAILMTGRLADAAYWMSNDGKWITSDYYREDLPGYLRNLNESESVKQYAGKEWKPLLPADRYQHGSQEDSFGERPLYGETKDFPHVVAAASDKYYIRQMVASPFGNDATLTAAREVLVHEKLGEDETTDLLTINLSSNDYVGHVHGPYSLEVEDMTYRTDLQLAEFAQFVDKQINGRPWLLAITADHGVAPVPEWAAKHKLNAKRNPLGTVDRKTGNIHPAMEKLETHLREKLKIAAEQPHLVAAFTDNQVYFTSDHPSLGLGLAGAAQRLTRDWLLSQDGVAVALTREQLLSGSISGDIERAVRRSFHAQRSGDVLFALAPYHLHSEYGTSHGSPWQYDTHVPLLMLSRNTQDDARLIRSGRFDRRISPAALAPTLARVLAIDPPAACAEQPLQEILPAR